jgi:transcriptional regulator with XRE-family HTH domain
VNTLLANNEHHVKELNIMDINKQLVGKNIKKARAENRLTQSKLAKAADISQTQLSDYENGNKLPGLLSIAKIAHALNRSIDELCFGDASTSPITTAPNEGRLIANCIYQLWKYGVLDKHAAVTENGSSYAMRNTLDIKRHSPAIKRLLETLNNYHAKEYTFNNPDLYLEQVLDSISSEIETKRQKRSEPDETNAA